MTFASRVRIPLTLPSAALLVMFAAVSVTAAETSEPQLVFAGDTVSVKGIKPGADVYLFSISREARGYYNQIVYREIVLHDAAKNGQVDYKVSQRVPIRSVWFAVDQSTGLAIAGSPPGYAPQLIPLDSRHLKKDVDGDISRLSYDGAVVDVVVVRPGAGVWGATAGVHSAGDEGSDDHGITISSVKLQPRVGTAATAPSKLKNGDVVFMMNSYAAQYSYAIVGGAK